MVKSRSTTLALASLLAAFAFAGCSSEDGAENDTGTEAVAATTQQASPTYVISFTATAKKGETILVRGRTNLPDGAEITLTASNAFRFKRESDTRASALDSAKATVQTGKFVTTLGPLEYGDITVGLEPRGGDLDYGPIAIVDDAVTVCAQLQTGEDVDGLPRQPDDAVQETLGPNGERLKFSPQATEFGSLTPTPSYWLEVIRRVKGAAPGLVSAVASAQGSRPARGRLEGFCLS